MHGRLPFPMAQTALARSDGARKRLRPRVDARARVCSVLLWGPGSGDPVGGGGGGWGYGGQQPRQGEPGEPSYNICVYIYIIYIRRDDIYIYIYIYNDIYIYREREAGRRVISGAAGAELGSKG